jgi:hypothetical protein
MGRGEDDWRCAALGASLVHEGPAAEDSYYAM